MQIFVNGKQRFDSFMEFYVTHASKISRGKILIIVPL